MTLRPLWLVALILALPTVATTRQDPRQPPVFRSDVELVTVDAVVVDSDGQPVAGLTRDDFVVLEMGVPQVLAAFEAIAPAETGAAPAASPPSAPAAPPSPARVASNLGPRPGATFLVVVDDIHLSSRSAVESRDVLERFLRESCREADRVAIVSTRTGSGWSGTLPDDRDDLLAFVRRLESRARDTGPQLMTEFEALRIAEYDDRDAIDRVEGRYWLQRRCFEGPGDCATVVRADARALHSQAQHERTVSLAAVEAAIETLSRARGRKTVLFMTEGFPHDAGEEPSRRVVRAAERVNAAVYFVDVRGVVASPPWASADAPNDAQLNPSRMDPGRITRVQQMMARAARDRLRQERYIGVETMADETGGRVLRGTNDLATGLARVAAEARSYYLLGYHPTGPVPEGKLRKLEVQVRRQGLTVRARKGYQSGGPGRTDAALAREAGTDVGMRLSTYTLEPLPSGMSRVAAAVDVDVAAGAARFKLRVEAIPRDGGAAMGHSLVLESEPLPVPPEGAPVAQWRTARVEFELPAGLYQVVARARETSSGRVGVVTQRVEVSDPAGFRVSTPILTDTVAALSHDAAAGPQPVMVAHRSFSRGSGRPLFCAFEVIGAAADPATGRSQVSVGFELEDAAGAVVATLSPSALVPANGGRLQAVLALPLAQLSPGDYALDLKTVDHVANRTQRLRESFRVEDAPASRAPQDARAGATAPAPPVPEELRGALERAGRYVAGYATAFSHVFAEESYQQDYTDPSGRRTVRQSRADVVFVSLPGPVPWTVFRDVIEVDGSPVGDRAARLKRLFVESPDTAVEKARKVLAESGRYNLGPLRRSVNFPTLALTFLLPESQPRFAFERKGRRSVGGVETIEVAYAEKARPTIVRDGSGHDVLSRGRFWIDPETGQVLQSVLEQDPNGHDWLAWARIAVDYRREPRLDILVPASMSESYGTPDSDKPQVGGVYNPDFDALRRAEPLHIQTTARYSAYGHFQVETQESFRPAPP